MARISLRCVGWAAVAFAALNVRPATADGTRTPTIPTPADPCTGAAASLKDIGETQLTIQQNYNGSTNGIFSWGLSLCTQREIFACNLPPAYVSQALPSNQSTCYRAFNQYIQPWGPTVGIEGLRARIGEQNTPSYMEVTLLCDPTMNWIQADGHIEATDLPGEPGEYFWQATFKSKAACAGGLPPTTSAPNTTAPPIEDPCAGVASGLKNLQTTTYTIKQMFNKSESLYDWGLDFCALQQPFPCNMPPAYVTESLPSNNNVCYRGFSRYDTPWRLTASGPEGIEAGILEQDGMSYFNVTVQCNESTYGLVPVGDINVEEIQPNVFAWDATFKSKYACAGTMAPVSSHCVGPAADLTNIGSIQLIGQQEYNNSLSSFRFGIDLCEASQVLPCTARAQPPGFVLQGQVSDPNSCFRSFDKYKTEWALSPAPRSGLVASLLDHGSVSYMDVTVLCDFSVDSLTTDGPMLARELAGHSGEFVWTATFRSKHACYGVQTAAPTPAPPPTTTSAPASVAPLQHCVGLASELVNLPTEVLLIPQQLDGAVASFAWGLNFCELAQSLPCGTAPSEPPSFVIEGNAQDRNQCFRAFNRYKTSWEGIVAANGKTALFAQLHEAGFKSYLNVTIECDEGTSSAAAVGPVVAERLPGEIDEYSWVMTLKSKLACRATAAPPTPNITVNELALSQAHNMLQLIGTFPQGAAESFKVTFEPETLVAEPAVAAFPPGCLITSLSTRVLQCRVVVFPGTSGYWWPKVTFNGGYSNKHSTGFGLQPPAPLVTSVGGQCVNADEACQPGMQLTMIGQAFNGMTADLNRVLLKPLTATVGVTCDLSPLSPTTVSENQISCALRTNATDNVLRGSYAIFVETFAYHGASSPAVSPLAGVIRFGEAKGSAGFLDPVDASQRYEQSAAAPASPNADTPTSSSKNKGLVAGVVILMILVLGACVVIGVLYRQLKMTPAGHRGFGGVHAAPDEMMVNTPSAASTPSEARGSYGTDLGYGEKSTGGYGT